MSKTINLKFQFDNPELLKSNLQINFQDETKKIVKGMTSTIGLDGSIFLSQETIGFISYFPYPILIKKGTSNLATVLITSKEILERCLNYEGDKPNDYNTLLFTIDTKTGIINHKFMAEKLTQQGRGIPAKETLNTKETVKPSKTEVPTDSKTQDSETIAPTKTPELPETTERFLKGKIVDKTGAVLKNTNFIVYIQDFAAIGGYNDIKLLPLLSSKSDSMGAFSVKVSNKNYQSASATVGNASSVFITIVLDNSKLPHFTLLLVDEKSAVLGDKEDSDCGCHDTPPSRLPEMEDLLSENSNYQQDIGGSCVNFTTPNRALEEFSYYSVVRLTDPEVMNAPGYVDNLTIRVSQLEKAIAETKAGNTKDDKLKSSNSKDDKMNGGALPSGTSVPNIFIPELQKMITKASASATNYKSGAEALAAYTAAFNKALQGREQISPEVLKFRPSSFFTWGSGILQTAPFTPIMIQEMNRLISLQTNFKAGQAIADKIRGGASTTINNSVTP